MDMPPSRERRVNGSLLSVLSLLISLCVTVVACGEGALPLSEWEGRWRDVVEEIQALRPEPITQQQCEETLGYLREQRPDLSPPPLADLDQPVDSWFALAEDAFFECEFGEVGSEQGRTFDNLRVFEAEVDVVLSLEG